jgi:broad specificity phosphatase PhoE
MLSSNHFFTRKILLVRHGRTDWNDTHRFQGHTDIPLNEAGLAQAETAARRIEAWPVDAVYTSPLTRARQTAGVIAAKHQKTPVVMDDLTEVNFGAWEGAHFKKLLEESDGLLLKWLADPFFCPPDGAEEWDSIRRRAERAANAVLDSGHGYVVIVSHGGIMKALLVAFLGLDPHTVWKIKASNCSLTGIEIREHETSLVFANDDLHLRDDRFSLPVLPVW